MKQNFGDTLIDKFSNGSYYTITIPKGNIYDLVSDKELETCKTKEDIDTIFRKNFDRLLIEYNWEP